MAEMTIHLRTNPESGKKDIIVELHNDADALPHEHEEHHKNLIDKLIEGGMLNATEVGKVVIQRQEEEAVPETPASNPELDQRQSHSEGS
jgi:hypothetical protein